jgi:hypothetical protein
MKPEAKRPTAQAPSLCPLRTVVLGANWMEPKSEAAPRLLYVRLPKGSNFSEKINRRQLF